MGGPAGGSIRGATIRVLVGAGVVGATGAGIGVARRVARGRAGTTPAGSGRGGEPRLGRAFPEAQAAGRALRHAGLSVAVAESCTGGLCGAALTAVAGSSAYVRGGVIAYSDEVKRGLLGVPAEVIARHGAVSRPCAEAMAEGVRAALEASIGVGITGVAGPGADGTAKPAGLVYVSVAGPGLGCRTVRLDRDRGREGNRAEAVRVALRMCREAASGEAR